MATKTDFTEDQWQTLAFAVTDAMLYVTVANGMHFWESVGETSAAAKYLVAEAKSSPSTLVRDLAMDAGHHRDKNAKDATKIEATTLDNVGAAIVIVNDVAPNEAEAFKGLVLGIAEAAAEAKNGVDDAEENAIDKLRSMFV